MVIVIDVLEDIKGGAERQVYELLKRMDRGRIEPCLYILHQSYVPREVSALGVNVKPLGFKRIYDFRGIWEGFKFARFIRREKMDVVLTYHFASDVWGTIFGKLGGVKTIISSRRDVGFWRDKNHVWAYKFVNRWVAKIITVSEAVKSMVVEEEGVASEKVVVVHNGVDVGRFQGTRHKSQVRKELQLKEEDRVVCSVGNFGSETKGQRVLVEAMRILLEDGRRKTEDGKNIKALLVGDGALKESLKSQVSSHKLENNVLFFGKRDDVADILAACDICVLPSLSEGFSNALLEYMAAGKAVVATAVGGNVEVVKDGVNGLLVPAKDPAALAVAIKKLLDDPALAGRLGSEARATVEQDFEVNKQIGKLLEFIANECCPSHKQ